MSDPKYLHFRAITDAFAALPHATSKTVEPSRKNVAAF